MFDKKKTTIKVASVTIITLLMGLFLHLYDLNAAAFSDRLDQLFYSLSPAREISYLKTKSQFKHEKNDATFNVISPSTWNGVPAFVYHGIVKETDRFSMTEATFKDQMFALKINGYETITLQELNDHVQNGTPLPAKSFLLTFDDGRRDSYEGADAVLRALDYTAVMFVAVESSMPSSGEKSTYYLSKEDLKRMVSSGRWEIGSHAIQQTGGYVPISSIGSQGNFLSNVAWIPTENRLETEDEYVVRITKEIADSKAVLEKLFGQDVIAFSYPFGDYGQQSHNNVNAETAINKLIQENYSLAFRQVWQEDGDFSFNYPDTEASYLKRIETPTNWTGQQLVDFLVKNHDKTLTYTDDFTADLGWHNNWGEKRLEETKALVIEATPETSGAAIFLDGSKDWQNYTYTATLSWTVGSHLSLMAQYQDAQNYLVCTFGEGRVRIEKIENGVSTRLTEVKSTRAYAKGGVFSMSLAGNSVQCSVDNVTVAWAGTSTGPGGIGLRIWDRELDLAAANITKVEVTPTKE